MMHQEAERSEQGLRIDKWLWAARFFKTRSLAAEALTGGKVDVNGERAKPSRTVRPGDRLGIRQGPYEWTVIVRGVAKLRGPASLAQGLYEETEASRIKREATAAQLKLQRPPGFDSGGRPSKKERRRLSRFTGKGW